MNDRMNGPRLAITGSAGTGKTSLCQTVAARYGLAVIDEAMRARFEAGLDLHALAPAEHRALLEGLADQWIGRAVAQIGGFVADRTALDFAAFWLYNGYAVDDPDGFGRLLDRAAAATGRLDAVFVLPWRAAAPAADGVRSTNPWLQLHFQTVLEGLCRRWLPDDRLHFMPGTVTAPEDRLAFVLARL